MSERTSDPETVLSLRDVSKIYRLYRKPHYRLLDLFGLCPQTPAYFNEHAALVDIDLDFRHGEKVGIIGRNGAGKSTLLKIITGSLQPTGGTMSLNGTVSALLQIGTGFHPDFTGRQNVYSGFAHAGVTGRRADELFDEVVDFSELEEYIDQPIKTYSTGMAARLMFSAATLLVPDIFVIDELLGVGDAYFSHKSYERLRSLCQNNGTTLLLVTHDLYSALELCDRFIWIDRGVVRMDSDGPTTIKAYENSIKEQEEERLRQRNVTAVSRDQGEQHRLHVRLASRTGFALSSPLALATVGVQFDGGAERTLPVGEGHADFSLLAESNLGPPTTVDGRVCRCLETHGSIYHKVEWTVAVPAAAANLEGLRLAVHYEGAETAEALVTAGDGAVLLRRTIAGEPGWRELDWRLTDEGQGQEAAAPGGEYGTGRVRMTSVKFLDEEGQAVTHCRHGHGLLIETHLEVADLDDRDVTFVIGFHREGATLGSYVCTDSLTLPEGRECVVSAKLDPVLLGAGRWLVTIGFAEAHLYGHAYNPFFSVNSRWHHVRTRAYELEVESSIAIDKLSHFVHPAMIDVATKAVERPGPRATVPTEPSHGT